MINQLRKRVALVDAARQMGPAWAGFKLRYFAEAKAGLHVKRSPVGPWPAQPVASGDVPAIVLLDDLAKWLRSTYSGAEVSELRQHLDRLRNRTFNVFGDLVHLPSWHHDPTGDHIYESDRHWSRVPQHRGVDVKRVWEPSRFGWAYDLARLHLIDPQSGASDCFWELFEWWCEENLPNTGINWSCGQESSIRLIAVVIAADAMRDTVTPARRASLERFAEVTGARVSSNIAYARSQHNNHHTSEAAGLLTVGALFPHLPDSASHLEQGLREMKGACSTLIFDDGGSSQYSTNYHRVFLHGMSWATAVLGASGHSVPTELSSALERATEYWTALSDPTSGLVPLLGHDDGANILPAARLSHRDARPAMALTEALANSRTVLPPGPWDEAPLWLGVDPSTLRRDLVNTAEVGTRSFAAMGTHIAWVGEFRVIFRSGRFNFRPQIDDQLHVDVWHRGQPLVTSPGTYSYNPPDGTAVEEESNRPIHPGEPWMERLGPFLYRNWGTATCEISSTIDAVTLHGRDQHGDRWVERNVVITANEVAITDSSDSGTPHATFAGPGVASLRSVGDLRVAEVQVPESYGQKRSGRVARVTGGTLLVRP